jgi:hypothetical protein
MEENARIIRMALQDPALSTFCKRERSTQNWRGYWAFHLLSEYLCLQCQLQQIPANRRIWRDF